MKHMRAVSRPATAVAGNFLYGLKLGLENNPRFMAGFNWVVDKFGGGS